MFDLKRPLWCSVLIAFLTSHIIETNGQSLIQARKRHTAQRLSSEQSTYFAQLTDTNYMNELLDNILVPRVVGTQSHEEVFQYISAELQRQEFSVDIDEFVAKTPKFGKLKFHNIIGTLNPKAKRFLVLACHYDSKYFKDFEFIGAVDSGVPCAMMLNLAKVLKDDLETSKGDSNVSLKLIFFDGEEAFEHWGPKDSLYGAKNLASVWHKHKSTYLDETISEIDKIDIMILLDLIGSADPVFPSYFKNTEFWYNILANTEEKLFKNGLLVRKSNDANAFFPRIASNSIIEDDHIPFLRKGVPILHLIPTPFPKVWHQKSDNRDNIDMNTIENLNKILRVFVARYLHLIITSQNISGTNTNHNEL